MPAPPLGVDTTLTRALSLSLCVNRGLYIGDDISCFDMAAQLSAKVNFTLVPRPLKKVRREMYSCVSTCPSRARGAHAWGR
jgi:hypothetical protein